MTPCEPLPRRYLYKSNSQGVQDYLCNRLYTLPEDGVEGYLLQLVYLVLQRPHTSLERVLIDLCARSLRIAAKVTPCLDVHSKCGARSCAAPLTHTPRLQVYWLLLAYTQDFPKEKYAEELRDRCEEAAMDGYWVRVSHAHALASCVTRPLGAQHAVSQRLIRCCPGIQEPPFKNPRLPNSPQRGFNFLSPPLSPTGSVNSVFSPQGPRCAQARVLWFGRLEQSTPGFDTACWCSPTASCVFGIDRG